MLLKKYQIRYIQNATIIHDISSQSKSLGHCPKNLGPASQDKSDQICTIHIPQIKPI